jgi:carboxyl-terminal processing protease
MRIPCILLLAALSLHARELTPAQRKLNVDSFEYAWRTIADKMWEPMPAGLDWQKVHDQVLPKVEGARSMDAARAAMRDMISRLKMTHFGIVPGDVYETVATSHGDGVPGFDIRVLDGEAVVTTVDRDSPAARSGVLPGWRILSIAGADVDSTIRKTAEAYQHATTRELMLSRALASQFNGAEGAAVQVEFLDGNNKRVPLAVRLTKPRGLESKFGLLPPQHVWFESKMVGNTGYVRFNLFMDPARISAQFADAVQSCKDCDGFIIDLRGNPGGIGAMSMGMAGWFIDKSNQRLGTMKTKESELKFVVNSRQETYNGPLAILIDGMTGSTSEIFAGGLKDLGRAHVIGTRSAGAALPSMFERLPNGDGFQYAIANYISEGGKPLEGIGVLPDEEVRLTRKALLSGHDPVLDAALAWIQKQKDGR